MKTHDYETFATEYASLGIEGTQYLAFRDVPHLIQKYVSGTHTLDYGCGAGRSTRLLKSFGLDTVGVDISEDMLQQARQKDPQGVYRNIEGGELPFENESFDFVFSSFVFIEVSSLEKVEAILKEFRRILKPHGVCIFITISEPGYKGDWVSFSYDFPENGHEIKSGDTVKLQFRGNNTILYDYYWTHRDFVEVFERSGFHMQELHQPLGLETEGIDWRDEAHSPPVSLYVLKG